MTSDDYKFRYRLFLKHISKCMSFKHNKYWPFTDKLKDCIRNTTTVCNPRQSQSETKFSLRQIQSETKFSLRQNSVHKKN